MSRRPDCTTCFDTAFYQGDPITRTEEEMGPGLHRIYPSVLCTCAAAKNWLESRDGGLNEWQQASNHKFELGKWDGYCYSVHKTQYVWYGEAQVWVALDHGIIDDTLKLWHHGIETEYSCEGGGGSTRYFKLRNVNDIPLAVTLLPWVEKVEDTNGRRAIYGHWG